MTVIQSIPKSVAIRVAEKPPSLLFGNLIG
jgi:hypothetical protein